MASILSVGESALTAAQAGLATTSHNIANVSTPGYSRQLIEQTAVGGQNEGFGFVGKGTQVVAVRRVYSDFLAAQLNSSQSNQSQLETYNTQIQQINNMLADPQSGLSPSLQDFFNSVQSLASDPTSAAARDSMLSSANAMAARFQSTDGQLTQIRQGVNAQIKTSVDTINSYAKQIANLNNSIEAASRGDPNNQPNDLLDQRDYAVSQLAKEIQVNVVKVNGNYDVYVGNGQPLVVDTHTFQLSTSISDTDPTRTEVAYTNNGTTVNLAESTIAGGNLGALMQFRAQSLDPAQNAVGRMGLVLASAVNAQQALGQDQNGNPGQPMFRVAAPVVTSSRLNTGTGTATASIADPSQLTTSDYRVQVTAAGTPPTWQIIRNADGKVFTGSPATLDGVNFDVTGAAAAGDEFLVRPTYKGADANLGIAVVMTNKSEIAAAVPIRTDTGTANSGSGVISAGTVNAPPPVNADLQQPVTITFTSPTTYSVTGTGTGLPVTNQTYTPGADISYNGWTVQVSGQPAANDTFSIGPNTGGVGDGRNALAIGAIQTANIVDGNATTVQGALSQMVSTIGNKTRELEVTGAAAAQRTSSIDTAMQSQSGVNLDEEAANLMRYQQAYQAAGKVMKTASDLFSMLLDL